MISQASSMLIRLQAFTCENIKLSSWFAFEQTSLRQFVSLCMHLARHFGFVSICDITWRIVHIFELTVFVNRMLAAGRSCLSTQRTIYISDGDKYSPFLGLNQSFCKNSELQRFSEVTTWLWRCSWVPACLQGISELFFRLDGSRLFGLCLNCDRSTPSRCARRSTTSEMNKKQTYQLLEHIQRCSMSRSTFKDCEI